MAERHRAAIEFVEWDEGYVPGHGGYRRNPPAPVQGVWLKRRVRGRIRLYRIGPGDLLTDAETAAILGMTRQTIRNWRIAGQLPSQRRSKTWYFTFADVRELHLKRHGELKRTYLIN
jgi:hypothetical protein